MSAVASQRRAKDAGEVRLMLRQLRSCLENPHLLEQAARKTNADTLYGLAKWADHGRKCKICHRRIGWHREKACCPAHARTLSRSKREAAQRRAGRALWFDFAQRVQAPLPIAAVAEKLGISAEQAQARAEAMVARGEVIAWRGKHGTGPIREIGVPKPRGARR